MIQKFRELFVHVLSYTKHTKKYPFTAGPPDSTLNLTITPDDIKEGDISVIECAVLLDPPTPGGLFKWMLKGQTVRNGQRINIVTKYDPLGRLYESEWILKNSSWTDSGKTAKTVKAYDILQYNVQLLWSLIRGINLKPCSMISSK